MKKKAMATKSNLDKKVTSFLKSNPEVAKTLKVFNMNLSEYTEAIKSTSSEQPIISFKSTQWLPGNR